MLNMYEVLFVLSLTISVILIVFFIFRFFTGSKYNQREVMRKLNEIDEEIKKVRNKNS